MQEPIDNPLEYLEGEDLKKLEEVMREMGLLKEGKAIEKVAIKTVKPEDLQFK